MSKKLILAKPGAGKSTRIAERAAESISRGERAFLTSFGRKNVSDLILKVGRGLPLPKHKRDLLTCRTIHSLLYRELSPDPGLYLPKILVKHQAKFGLFFSSAFAKTLDSGNELPHETDLTETDDTAYAEVQRLRARMLTWRDTRYSGAMAERIKLMWEIHEDAFRKDFWDFTWLLEEGVRRGSSWSADYCAVDEINDLNALQATLMSRLTGKAVEYVGDLDQAIYGFAGVDPQTIEKILPYDTVETMELSYRLTAPIAERAERVLAQASWRSQGHIRTERTGGDYGRIQLADNILLSLRHEMRTDLEAAKKKYGDIYVIGRTNWLVNEARRQAIEYGMNVAETGEEELLKAFCEIIKNPGSRMQYRMIPALTAPFLGAREYYRRGAKAALKRLHDNEPEGSMEWSAFYAQYGLERLKRAIAGDWREWYHGKVVDPLKPILRFDTFHASKGMEADTVILLTDITERVETESVRDEEIRLAYVATTRARDLVLPAKLNPEGWQSKFISLS